MAKKRPSIVSKTRVNGGVNVDADGVEVEGDVVGHDKIDVEPGAVLVGKGGRYTALNVPRWLQIEIGVAAVVLVVLVVGLIAVVLITRPSNVVNGNFDNQLQAWEVTGDVEVVATGEASTSPAGQQAAQVPIGVSIQQTVTINASQPLLTVWYRWPPDSAGLGTLNVYLNNDLQITAKQVAVKADQWTVAVVPDLRRYAGKPVRLRLEYAEVSSRVGGHLSLPALQRRDVLWITNIKFVASDELARMAVTATPSPQPSSTPTPTNTPTSTPTALPTPTSTLTPTATSSPSYANTISNFRVISATTMQVEFEVDYTADAAHGNDVLLGALVMQNGSSQDHYIGYMPDLVSPGSGTATITVIYGYNDPPASLTTDQIQVIMYSQGGSTYFQQTFNYRKTWYR